MCIDVIRRKAFTIADWVLTIGDPTCVNAPMNVRKVQDAVEIKARTTLASCYKHSLIVSVRALDAQRFHY